MKGRRFLDLILLDDHDDGDGGEGGHVDDVEGKVFSFFILSYSKTLKTIKGVFFKTIYVSFSASHRNHAQVSLEERMLREPFWLGLIAVFFVMILIGFAIIVFANKIYCTLESKFRCVESYF